MRALVDRFCGSLLSDAQALEAPLFAGRERSSAADLLVRIAEIDVRKLYLPAGYPTMLGYCMAELRLSEDRALNRLHAGRTARRFPVLFEALDEGRLDLTGVRLLASHLTEENVQELIAAAAECRGKSELQAYLHHRFPEPNLLSAPRNADHSRVDHLHVPEHVSGPNPNPEDGSPAPDPPPAGMAVTPVPLPVAALEWVDLKVKARRAKWQRACDLLSHSLPSGDPSAILDRALDALIEKAEKRRFAACQATRGARPRAMRRRRGIPAAVRRAVWERDRGQCTFVSESGKRCASTRVIEFDHEEPVARGGTSSVENLRLRCRGHNQYAAEQAFGAEFMKRKREKPYASHPLGHRFRDDVMAGLRALGVSATEARQAMEKSGALDQPTLEESLRTAIRCLGPRRRALSSG